MKNRTSIIEGTIVIDLGTPEEPRERKIEKILTPKKQEKFASLLRELVDVFS